MRRPTIGHFGVLYSLTQIINVKADDICLANLRSGLYGDIGLDVHGHPVEDVATAVAVSLKNCWKHCAATPFHKFLAGRWMDILTQFAAWELPWLALVSQLPYDPNANHWENFQSLLLMIGSPALTGYTQAMTVLNNRWIVNQFAQSDLPHSHYLVRVLSDLQHVPFNINSDVRLLASLLALPENREFWETLVTWMDYTHSNMWTAYTKFSIAWVIIAYSITVADGFGSSYWPTLASHGQSIGASWFWLIPAVLIWMRLSPKSDIKKIQAAISSAHARAYVVGSDGIVRHTEDLDPLFVVGYSRKGTTWHVESASPIHDHSRFHAWSQLVEFFHQTHSTLSRLMQLATYPRKIKIDNASIVHLPGANLAPAVSVIEFENLVQKGWDADVGRWSSGTIRRTIIAVIFGLSLQAGTTLAAFIMNYFTPTYGIGCSSLASLVYGLLAIISWLFIVVSSALSHQHATSQPKQKQTGTTILSSFLRLAGKGLAYINAILFIVGNFAEITLLTSECFCNSSWFSLGNKAFVVLFKDAIFLPSWGVGIGMVVFTSILYCLFLHLLMPKPLPKPLSSRVVWQ